MDNQNLENEISKSLWAVFTTGQKLFVCLFFGIIIFTFIFAFAKLFNLNWSVLYTDLDFNDAVNISRTLKENGYSAKVGKDNKSILVPANLQDKVRVYVAENGLLSSDSAYMKKTLSEHEAYRYSLENQIAKKVQTVLEKIVGKGNVSVQVNADIDFSAGQYTVERNIPNFASDSKEIKQFLSSPGTIRRITIGVAVNKILTSTEKKELTELIASAGGINFARGDTVAVSSLRFLGIDEEKAEKALLAKDAKMVTVVNMVLNEIIPLTGLILLFVIALLLVRVVSGKRNSGQTGQKIYSVPESIDYRQYEPAGNADNLEVSPEYFKSSDESIEYVSSPGIEQMKKDLNETVLKNTSEIAKLLVSYIKD